MLRWIERDLIVQAFGSTGEPALYRLAVPLVEVFTSPVLKPASRAARPFRENFFALPERSRVKQYVRSSLSHPVDRDHGDIIVLRSCVLIRTYGVQQSFTERAC